MDGSSLMRQKNDTNPLSAFTVTTVISTVFFSDSLPGYRWGANWCCGIQLCWLLNCQGAKSKGVSFVNYTQCYKQSCSFEPFLSSTIHKYFGSGTKRKKRKQFTHNYHSGMSRLPADVCLDYNGSRGRASLT